MDAGKPASLAAAPARVRRQLVPDAGFAGATGFAAGLASALPASVFGAALVSPAAAEPPLAPSAFSVRLRFLSPSFLKSVSYQPLPDSRKLGAVICRVTASALHS